MIINATFVRHILERFQRVNKRSPSAPTPTNPWASFKPESVAEVAAHSLRSHDPSNATKKRKIDKPERKPHPYVCLKCEGELSCGSEWYKRPICIQSHKNERVSEDMRYERLLEV